MQFSQSKASGHLLAIFTILVWGTTYISTKVLLTGFKPVEILLIRFVIGFLVLFLMHPRLMKPQGWKKELLFAACGLSGITFYYLAENVALTMTQASNVGVIICVAPFFTAIGVHLVWRKAAPLRAVFFIGFIVAMAGVCLISFNGEAVSVSWRGDLLALLAAIAWSVYSVLMRIIGKTDYPTVVITRRFFFYGILFMIPPVCFFSFSPDLSLLAQPKYLLNLLFLGLIASAVCFLTWNCSVRILGAVATSVYIYLTPVVTVITAMLVLDERLSAMEWLGVALTMAGLLISEFGSRKSEG